MTGFHRLPILAIAALLAAGCGATPPTTMPSASIAGPTEATGSPAPSVPHFTQAPTGNDCPPLDAAIAVPSADFTVWTPVGGAFLGLDVTRISSILNAGEFVEFTGGKPYRKDPIHLVGGWQIGLDPDDEMGPSIVLLNASAQLLSDGRDPVQMEGTVGTVPKTEMPGFLFDVPDVKGTAMAFTVEWSDECFIYRAEKVWGVEVARAAQAERCPSDHEGYETYWTEDLGDPPFLVAGVPVSFFRTETGGYWIPYQVGSQGNTGIESWDPSADPAVGEAGGILVAGGANPDLEIASMSVEFYRRGAVLDSRAGGAWPRSVFRATADPYPDGHFDLLLPSDPGRYVATLFIQWDSFCAYGGAVGAVGVDVK